jgi:3-(3-hydroxy-phenyl)propionate hydroxylase
VLRRWIGPEEATLWRQASYRFHALVAREWRRGRVFIAGDAAHQQPPFLGQGMCQGVRDVVNLVWKLRAVLAGEVSGAAAEALLDTYTVERREHVRRLTTRIKEIGAVICERDPEAAKARDAALIERPAARSRPCRARTSFRRSRTACWPPACAWGGWPGATAARAGTKRTGAAG